MGGWIDARKDLWNERILRGAWNNLSANAALTFNHAEHRRLADIAGLQARLNVIVAAAFEAQFSADERFVNFYVAIKGLGRPVTHSNADAVQHEPRRLLRDVQSASDFARRDTIAVARQESDRRKPLVKADRRIFEDGPNLGRKLPLAVVTVQRRRFGM